MTRLALAAAFLLGAATLGGAYLLLTHGPQYLVGAGWGEGCDEEVTA